MSKITNKLLLCYDILGQLEAKMKSTAESMQEIEAKKRQLEEHVSTVNENLLKYIQNITDFYIYFIR